MSREKCPRIRIEDNRVRCSTPYTTSCHFDGDDFHKCGIYKLIKEDERQKYSDDKLLINSI